MNSTDLIGDARKRFDELQEDSSFEDSIENIIYLWEDSVIESFESNRPVPPTLKETLTYQLQQIKELHWRSFYIGWLEGRINLIEK